MASTKTQRSSADATLPTGWLPMRTAPRDGTIILISELGNGEHANVMPAAFLNCMGHGEPAFWGVWPTSRLPVHMTTQQSIDAVREVGLPVDFRFIALTPLCWQPMPQPESMAKLRRRQGQILAAKYPTLKAVV